MAASPAILGFRWGHFLTFSVLAVLLLWEVGYSANLPPRTVTVNESTGSVIKSTS